MRTNQENHLERDIDIDHVFSVMYDMPDILYIFILHWTKCKHLLENIFKIYWVFFS